MQHIIVVTIVVVVDSAVTGKCLTPDSDIIAKSRQKRSVQVHQHSILTRRVVNFVSASFAKGQSSK